HRGVLVGDEDEPVADEAAGPVLVQVVGPEVPALGAVVDLGGGGQGGDAHRVDRLPDVEHPGVLDLVGAVVGDPLVGHDAQVAGGQGQGRVGAAAEGRRPVAVGQQPRGGRVGHVVDGQAAVTPGAVGEPVSHDRVVQGVAALGRPVRPLAGGQVHAGKPPAAGDLRPGGGGPGEGGGDVGG